MGRIKMAKEKINKKESGKKTQGKKKYNASGEEVNKTARYVAIFLLLIMVFSVVGFAMLGTGVDNDGNVNEQGIPEYLPFQQLSQEGQTFWAAVINYELFVFETIEGYDQREDLAQAANSIKQFDSVNLVLDENFTDDNFPYLIEQKFSNAFEIPVSRSQEAQCGEGTVILTNNENHSFDGSCLVIQSDEGEEERDSLIFSYHLVVNER